MLLYLLFLIIDIWSPHPIIFTKLILCTLNLSAEWVDDRGRKKEGCTWKREAMPHAKSVLPMEFGSWPLS